jgi:hypothetical protein
MLCWRLTIFRKRSPNMWAREKGDARGDLTRVSPPPSTVWSPLLLLPRQDGVLSAPPRQSSLASTVSPTRGQFSYDVSKVRPSPSMQIPVHLEHQAGDRRRRPWRTSVAGVCHRPPAPRLGWQAHALLSSLDVSTLRARRAAASSYTSASGCGCRRHRASSPPPSFLFWMPVPRALRAAASPHTSASGHWCPTLSRISLFAGGFFLPDADGRGTHPWMGPLIWCCSSGRFASRFHRRGQPGRRWTLPHHRLQLRFRRAQRRPKTHQPTATTLCPPPLLLLKNA